MSTEPTCDPAGAQLDTRAPAVALSLAGFVAETSDLLERFRPFAQAIANPVDLDDRTRALLAAIASLTAARTALQKAGAL